MAQTAPDLTKAINRENDRLIKANTKELQKYDYPMNVITAAMMKRYARYGVDLKIRADDCIQVGSLDAQKQAGKRYFGDRAALLVQRAERRKNNSVWPKEKQSISKNQRWKLVNPPRGGEGSPPRPAGDPKPSSADLPPQKII